MTSQVALRAWMRSSGMIGLHDKIPGGNTAMITLTAKDVLPDDGTSGTLVGRVWLPQADGPAVVAIRSDGVFDVTAHFPTVSALCEEADPAASLRAVKGER